jgi:tetratricopeptide (TPR) repeat protein
MTKAEMQHDDTYDLFQQGRAHLDRGDNAQATVALEKAKRREPDKASIREALGVAYLRLHRYREAAAEFEHILDAAPANDYAHYCLGRCLSRMGQPRLAAGHYKMASWLRPEVEYYREAAGADAEAG